MAFSQLTSNLNIIQALDDLPNDEGGLTADQLKAKFDEAVNIIKTYINDTLLAELAATTADASGASNIGLETITGIVGNTIQDFLENLIAKLNATTDGASGADFTGLTSITGITGNTVQAALEYLILTYLQDTTGTAGSKKVGTPAIVGVTGSNVADQLSNIYSQILSIVLGQIPDGSLTEAKMSNEMKKDIAGGVTAYNTFTTLSNNFTTHLANNTDYETGLIYNVRW